MNPVSDLAVALSALPDGHLDSLRFAIEQSPGIVPAGLLAWLEHAIGWEIDRRAGFEYALQGPLAAIDDNEVERSVIALAAMAAQFRCDGRIDSVPVAAFIDLTAQTLCTEIEYPKDLQ